MTKLNKTQMRLMTEANESSADRVTVIFGSGRGANGAVKELPAMRQRDALAELMKIGFITPVSFIESVAVKNGYQMYYYESTYHLTPKGKAFMESLSVVQ